MTKPSAEEQEQQHTPQHHAIAVDETRHYNLRPGDERLVVRILQVYVFDRASCTHCCELTPSYWLEPAYCTVATTDEATDEERDAVDQRYCYEPSEGCYIWCRDVERMIAQHPGRCKAVEADTMDEAREKVCANYPF